MGGQDHRVAIITRGSEDPLINNAGVFIAKPFTQSPEHAPETYDVLAGLHPLGRVGQVGDIVDGILLESSPFIRLFSPIRGCLEGLM
jgi:hypothetical protein